MSEPSNSPSDYKTQTLESLAAAQDDTRRNLEIAFDTSKTVKARLRALGTLGSIADENHIQRALELIQNSRVNADVRAALLDKIGAAIGNDEDLLTLMITMLRDSSEPEAIRQTALRILQANSFSSPTLLAQRPQYMSTLRALVDDPSDAIRESAIEHLAMNQDEYVQRRLIEGLENPRKRVVRPEKAVQLLSYDLHAEHFPLLRRLAQDPPNKKTRMEALRNLGADADSAGLLREALADDDEDPEVRHLSAVALKQLDPKGFEEEADRIVAEESAEPELKVALLNTKLHTPGTDQAEVAASIDGLAEAPMPKAASERAAQLRSIASKKTSG